MTAQGLPCSIAGVAKAYEDFLDLLVCDTRDARAAETLRKNGLRVQCAQTIMRTSDDRAALARVVLEHTIPGWHPGKSVADQSAANQSGTNQSASDKSARAAAEQP
jgi:2-phospho-L-lactate transferase/gluconeogenesis factor (CofD/UPF0052 family)